MLTIWLAAAVIACCVALAAEASQQEVKLRIAEEEWERRVFPPEGVAAEEAAVLGITQDPQRGACLALGPWRAGDHTARFQYRTAIPITRGVLRGRYRTENLPVFGAVVSIQFRAGESQIAIKTLDLGVAPDWRPFELAFRVAPPGATAISPGLGLSAHTEGRALFTDLTVSREVAPLSFPADLARVTRPRPPRGLKASGFYRVEESGGTWWLVTPEGEPFYSLGTDGPWFWGKGDVIQLGREAAEVLQGIGFNSLAGWTHVGEWGPINETLIKEGKPSFAIYTAIETGNWRNRCDQLVDAQGRTTGEGHAFADPFDPRFEASYREQVRRVAEVVRGKPWFAGYFADNEISHRDLYRHVYSPHCAAALREFLSQRYGGDIDRLNNAWGTRFSSFEGLVAQQPEPPARGAMHGDFRRFEREVITRYIDTTLRVIRGEDPDHLVISNRFMLGDVMAWIDHLDLYARYDLIALNLYPANQSAGLSETERAIYRMVHEKTGRPVMVGEWSVPAMDSGLYDDPRQLDWSWNEVVETQAERARQAACVTLDFYNMPFVVGSHWFIWQDFDSEKRRANRGLMRADGRPWQELVDALTQAQAAIRKAQARG